MHTSIVSRHLDTIPKYCAHLHHTVAALKRYIPASHVAPLSNSKQINHPSSNYIYKKSTPNHIPHHYAPSVTLTHINTHHFFQLLPHTHHVVTSGFVDMPRQKWLHYWPDGRRSWLVDHKLEHRTPPH